MPLNLEPRSADFVPYVKFNAKAGRWYSKLDTGEEFEVANMTAIFDLESIRVGWLHYQEGLAPDATWDSGPTAAAPPTPQHKRGFSLNVYSKEGSSAAFASSPRPATSRLVMRSRSCTKSSRTHPSAKKAWCR
jgi:hypothetical protein